MRSKVLRGCVGAFAALAMFVVPAAAQAASHPFLRVAASGTKTPLVPFETACGTAVGPDSRLLVSDYDQNVINAFVTALAPLAPLPSQLVVNESSPLEAPSLDSSACALAIDSGSNVYAASYHQGVLRYPAPSYLSPTTIGAGQATGVAVDRATDALYVTRPTHVDVYGAPVTPASVPSAIGTGSLTSAYGVAISGFPGTQGFVYVADAADDTVKVFDPATDIVNPIATIDGAGTPQGGFRDLTDTSLAIDDSSGQLFVLDNLQPGAEHPAAAVYAFDASGAYLGLLPKALVHGEPSGVAVDNSANPTQGLIYVTSGNEAYFNSRTSKNETPVVYAFCPTAPISSSLQKACPVPSPATSIEVSRAGSGRGTVVGAGAEVICGDLCATEADVGTVVTLVATPKPHSTFGGWSVSGGTSSCGAAATCKVTLSSAAEVTATFAAIPQRQLTVSKDGSGSGAVTSSPVGLNCGSICGAGFDQGTVVSLSPEPGPGAEFAGWSGACSGTGACTVTLSADVAVTASFKPIERVAPIPPNESLRILAISVSGEGSGTITSEPGGIECGTPCSNAYAPGSRVTLSATPDRESRFAGWSGCDSVAADRCTVTLGSSRTVGASFAEAKPKQECKKKKGAKAGKCKGAKKAKSKKAKSKKKGKGKR